MFKRCRHASLCLALSICLFGAFALSGCTHVAPYQREYLTRPGMDPTGEGHAAEFEAHVQSAREGAIGGRNTVESTGGGCGCN
ncbi:MAG TPA: DUF4266 domain-containing protein [Polyangiales bacterium]|jgi:hypothetical protein|nr:DUF4266 domain-containing protein [Polyangiales bacterium]